MSSAQIFALAIAAIAVVTAVAVFAVVFRGGSAKRPRLDPAAVRRDRARREKVAVMAGAPSTDVVETAEPPAEEPATPLPDPLLEQRRRVSKDEYGVSRRQFFNRAILGVFGVFLLQFAVGFLAFFWPKLRAGGFGGKIDAGDVNDVKGLINQPDGTIIPLFVPAAQAYVVPFEADPSGSSFEERPEVIAGGLMAVWQRCVHLGCRVPVCLPSQGFECPCHGSRYNFHGEYEAGPAPRNMDRFVVEVNSSNRFVIDTGTVVQTARSQTKTIRYPQGPSCLSAGAAEHS